MSKRINISVLDDNPFFNNLASFRINNFLEEYSQNNTLDYRIMSFLHPEDLYQNLGSGTNIILLDYYLGDSTTAIDVLKKISEKNKDCSIAIVTQKDDPKLSFITRSYGASAFIPKDDKTLERACYFIEKTITKRF